MSQGTFQQAIERIDEANSQDPNTEEFEGESIPKELLYSRRISEWVERLRPNASEALRLAARSQHIRRWKIPRADFPMDRPGYHKWRTTLYRFHAENAAEILTDLGFHESLIATVQSLLQKKNLKTDPDMQTLEDAAALVFLQFHLADFAAREDIDASKGVDIIRKTWKKMSDQGHEAALGLDLPDHLAALVTEAISG